MTGFAHRLLGHDDPAGTIWPVVASLYEPASTTPGELDVFEEVTEFGAAPGPEQQAAGQTAGAPAAQAPAGRLPAPAAARPQGALPPASPVPSPLARPSAPGRRELQEHAPDGRVSPPLIPASAVPQVVSPPRAGERPRPGGPPPPHPPSRRPPVMAELRKAARPAVQASHQAPAADPARPAYPAFRAARAPSPGTGPALAAGRPGFPAISRPGNHPRPGPGQPDVHITIGRIDVRAVPEPARAARQEPRRPGAPTLQDYLRGRDGRA